MNVFKHHENKREISNNITSLYGTEHPAAAAQQDQQQNLSPFEHRELIKSQIAGSFNENTPTLSDEELEKSAEDTLEKGGKRAVIGERRQFGGREYIKTASGWKFHGKGGGAKATSHREGALDHHVETGKGAGEKKGEVGKVGKPDSITLDKDHKDKVYEITNPMVKFLDAHKFTSKEMKDYDYISEKIHNYAENVDIEFSETEAVDLAKQYEKIKMKEGGSKETSKHIGDMSATDMKAAADKLGIDVKGKTTKQVREALTSANIDKQMADFKAKKEQSSSTKQAPGYVPDSVKHQQMKERQKAADIDAKNKAKREGK